MSKLPQQLAELIEKKKAELLIKARNDDKRPLIFSRIENKHRAKADTKPVVIPRAPKRSAEQNLEPQIPPKSLQMKSPLTKKVGRQVYQFEWDASEDTSGEPLDPIFVPTPKPDMLENEQKNDVHYEDKKFSELTARDLRLIRSDYKINVKGSQIPNPIRRWSDLALPSQFIRILQQMYEKPSPIQRQALTAGIEGRDVVGVAQTGSGKTLAFVVPLLHRILSLGSRNEGPEGLILVPTRELAQQIHSEILKFESFKVSSMIIIGGKDIESQSIYINRSKIIICTPGRLRECIERSYIVLSHVFSIVLDELDRMIDLGFSEDVNFILDSVPMYNDEDQKRQMMMFSATLPSDIEKIAQTYLNNPIQIKVATTERSVDSIAQIVEFLEEQQKVSRLLALLKSRRFGFPILVFVNTKAGCDVVGKSVVDAGFRTSILHGGKSQDAREAAIEAIRRGQNDILVCTSIASRGIDILNVQLVVNFDMALTIQDYTHRIGRTGRANKKGTAISFVTSGDSAIFYDLKVMVERCGGKLPTELRSVAPDIMEQDID